MQREDASTRSLVRLDGSHDALVGGNVAVDGWINVSFQEAWLDGHATPEHPTPFIYTVDAAAAVAATANSSRHREIDTLCREVETLRSHLVVAHDHIERLEHTINAKNAEHTKCTYRARTAEDLVEHLITSHQTKHIVQERVVCPPCRPPRAPRQTIVRRNSMGTANRGSRCARGTAR